MRRLLNDMNKPIEISRCSLEDYNQILEELPELWDGRDTRHLHPSFLIHEFGSTSYDEEYWGCLGHGIAGPAHADPHVDQGRNEPQGNEILGSIGDRAESPEELPSEEAESQQQKATRQDHERVHQADPHASATVVPPGSTSRQRFPVEGERPRPLGGRREDRVADRRRERGRHPVRRYRWGRRWRGRY
jgi:hypothetical protein